MVSWDGQECHCHRLPPGVLCPALGSPAQERFGHTAGSPAKGHKGDEGAGASFL